METSRGLHKVKYMIDEPKSETSKRDIPMLDNLVTVLREHRKRQLATRMLLGDKWRPEPGFENLVFTGSFGRCISENALYQDMKKIIVQIREDGHTFGEHTPHSLRHTFATRGFERGIPPKVMQEILGHKSITMTLDIYSHVLPDKKAEEINKLAAMF
nr:tyrosine-type recombinase/integrase [Blautia faecis]